jgi:hypothetical protein
MVMSPQGGRGPRRRSDEYGFSVAKWHHTAQEYKSYLDRVLRSFNVNQASNYELCLSVDRASRDQGQIIGLSGAGYRVKPERVDRISGWRD